MAETDNQIASLVYLIIVHDVAQLYLVLCGLSETSSTSVLSVKNSPTVNQSSYGTVISNIANPINYGTLALVRGR